MFKIVRIDSDRNEKVVAKNLAIFDAYDTVSKMAEAACQQLPNNPSIDVSGVGEISVYIGLYRQYTFKVIEQ